MENTATDDPNLIRGKKQFIAKLRSETYTLEELGSIEILVDAFSDKVGIMPSDEVYSSIRLSRACINIVKNTKLPNDSIVTKVIEYYHNSSVIPQQVKFVSNRPLPTKESLGVLSDAHTDSLYEELNRNSDVDNLSKYEIMYTDEDGNIKTKTIEVESIDLIKEVSSKNISIEGHRSLGNISSDFDTTSQKSIDNLVKATKEKLGKVVLCADGYSIDAVICPNCGKSDVISTGVTYQYTCFECDTEFRISMDDEDYDDRIEDSPTIVIAKH